MGRKLGPFEIVSELGRGGMGVVYHARDQESGQEVALKLTLQRMGSRRLERFRREGELTARLKHVGIVRVHSTGEVEGRPYLAYELVRGQSLDDALGGCELRRRVELIRDAARALGYAHQRGIVHRDVKGENILVDERGHVRVADFGLATATDLERLTQTGAMLGTPSHMAPELADRRSGEFAPAADVWSLGVILYRALTGALPFVAGSVMELAALILAAKPARPRRLDPDVPEALESICLRALSPRPEDRHADGDAFADDLDDWLAGRWKSPPRSVRLGSVVLPTALACLALWWIGARTASSVEESEVNRPPPPTPRDVALQARLDIASRELKKLERLEDPRQRVEQLERFCEKNRSLPSVVIRAARDLIRRAQLEFPLLEIAHAAHSHQDAQGKPVERPFQPKGLLVKAFFLDDEHLLTQGADRRLRCWSLANPQGPEWELAADLPSRCGLAVHPDGKTIVTSRLVGPERRHTMFAIELPSLEVRTLGSLPSEGWVVRVLFSADGTLLALGNRPHGVTLYRWPGLEPLHHFPCDDLRNMKLSPSGALLAAAGGGFLNMSNSTARAGHWLAVWDVESGESVCKVDMNTAQTAVDFVDEERSLIAGSETGRLHLIALDDPQGMRTLHGDHIQSVGGFMSNHAHNGEISGIWVHPDGRHVFTTNSVPNNGVGVPELRVWDVQSAEQVRRVVAHRAALVSLQPSPDGTRLAIGTGFLDAQVWRAEAR